MTGDRLREIFYFFRSNAFALLLVGAPFALAGTLVTQLSGQPLVPTAETIKGNWLSIMLLLALYPLALGVKIRAIHLLACGETLRPGALLAGVMPHLPSLVGTCAAILLMVGLALLAGVGFGVGLMNAAGALGGVGEAFLVLFAMPAVYVYTRLAGATLIVVLEGKETMEAVREALKVSAQEAVAVFQVLLMILSMLLVLMVMLSMLVSPDDVATATATATAGAASTADAKDAVATHPEPSAPVDAFLRVTTEWASSLVTIALYRFWSLRIGQTS